MDRIWVVKGESCVGGNGVLIIGFEVVVEVIY